MRSIRKARMRFKSILFPSRVDDRLDAEIQFHFEQQIEENIRQGMDQDAARRAALLTFGGVDKTKERCRDSRRVSLADTVARDIRYAARLLARSPGFSAVMLLSLALGIGANTAIFSLIDGVFLKPLPVEHPSELFQVTRTSGNGEGESIPYPVFKELRSELPTTLGFANRSTHTGAAEEGETIETQLVSDNYFDVLGIRPIIGRAFPTESALAQEPESLSTAIVSYKFWTDKFHRDPTAIGRTITLNKARFTVVGVMPYGFYGVSLDSTTDVWVPIRSEPLFDGESDFAGGINWVQTVTRVRPPSSSDSVRVRADAVYQQWVQLQNSIGAEPQRLILTSAGTPVTKGRQYVRLPFLLLMGAVLLVLLIACANITNLMLAKAASRGKELAIRASLGAARSRLARQLLTETLLITTLGGILGLGLAFLGNRLLLLFLFSSRLVDRPMPPALELSPDLQVLVFTGTLTVLVGLLAGLAPAIRASRIDLTAALKDNASQSIQGIKAARGRVLLTGQLAVSLLLLVIAVLLVRSFQNVMNVDLGFKPDRIAQVRIYFGDEKYTAAQFDALWSETYDSMKSLPGAESASMSFPGIFSHANWTGSVSANRQEIRDNYFYAVTPEFFSTMLIPLAAGRTFDPSDGPKSPPVAILNQTAARTYFGSGSAIGKYLRLTGDNVPIEVVGVVRDTKLNSPIEPAHPTIYKSIAQSGAVMLRGLRVFEVRAAGDPAVVLQGMRKIVQQVAPDDPPVVSLLRETVNQSLWIQRMVAWLSGLLGLTGLGLACIGVYGLVSYAVTSRTEEIGLRLALGARPGTLAWLIWQQAMRPVTIGIAFGLAAAAVLTRVTGSLLFGLTATDPVTFGLAALLFGFVAGLAAYLPARRATKVDPMVALRFE